MKKWMTIVMVFVCCEGFGQTFYVNTINDQTIINNTYQLNINNCDSTKLYTCAPSQANNDNVDYHYLDIAIDAFGNLYYLSGFGRLYTRKLSDNNSCKYLGQFGNGDLANTIVALVADDKGNILAAGTEGNVSTLYEYQPITNSFKNLGNFPTGFQPSGDLFFYEGNLFMTAYNTDAFLVEVTVGDPSKSCYYMDLGNITPYAAFSIQYSTYSDAYIIDTKFISPNNYISSLYKLNLVSKTIYETPICAYPFEINGAASVYNFSPSIIDSNSCNSLPINLLNFTPTLLNNSVKLQWQTASESNSNYFSIERSEDGINFNAIGKTVAAGNSTSVKQYSFTDLTPNPSPNGEGDVYYRLKEVDQDGKFTYSNILLVKVPQRSNISVNPNPATDRIFITSSAPVQKIEIINPQGVVVLVQNNVTSNEPVFLSNLSRGIYFAKVYTANGIVVKEFVKE